MFSGGLLDGSLAKQRQIPCDDEIEASFTVSFVIYPLHSLLQNFQLLQSGLHSYVWKRRRGIYIWGGSS